MRRPRSTSLTSKRRSRPSRRDREGGAREQARLSNLGSNNYSDIACVRLPDHIERAQEAAHLRHSDIDQPLASRVGKQSQLRAAEEALIKNDFAGERFGDAGQLGVLTLPNRLLHSKECALKLPEKGGRFGSRAPQVIRIQPDSWPRCTPVAQHLELSAIVFQLT